MAVAGYKQFEPFKPFERFEPFEKQKETSMKENLKIASCVIKNLLTLRKMEPSPTKRLHIASTAIRIAMEDVSPQEAHEFINYAVDFVSKYQKMPETMSLQTTFWLKKPPDIKTEAQALILLREIQKQNLSIGDAVISLVMTIRMISKLSKLGWNSDQLKRSLTDHLNTHDSIFITGRQHDNKTHHSKNKP